MTPERLDRALAHLPRHFPGPGGGAAVLRHGEVLVRHTWGFADAERRIAFTPRSLFRMCSITKQFTCGTALALFPDLAALDAAVGARLPRLDHKPTALQLAHNQSGLRDYWAVAMLLGAPATASFGDRDAAGVIGAAASLQFAPGTSYSYSNGNFRLLSDALEDVTGRSFSELLRRHVLEPAGMETAFLAADTTAMPDGTVGYEGSLAIGHRPAENRVIWTGDAGLGASLDDMVAWERHIDATRDDPAGLYRRLSAPVAFACGTPAEYGFGLARSVEWGRAATGHGGALRGWRSHRIHFTAERVSVVVMLNHLSDARAAALQLAAALFGEEVRAPDAALPAPVWLGAYVEPATGLSARVELGPRPGELRLRYGHGPELLQLRPDGTAGGPGARLAAQADGTLRLERPGENRVAVLEPCTGAADPAGLAGRYRCGDYPGAALDIVEAGGVPHAAFAGPLGAGRMEPLEPIGPDLWLLPCWRALDHTPPGDWTILVHRGMEGGVTGLTVGCWLARGLRYEPDEGQGSALDPPSGSRPLDPMT